MQVTGRPGQGCSVGSRWLVVDKDAERVPSHPVLIVQHLQTQHHLLLQAPAMKATGEVAPICLRGMADGGGREGGGSFDVIL